MLRTLHWKLLPAAALCLALCGCSFLLERSYSVVEPYANRYWDSSAEDTLRAENYQDLVNSLLMLVEQRAEEGVIRCYEEANSYLQAQRARAEVRRETRLGSYLLQLLTFSYESGQTYSTVTYRMTYREDTEDISALMTLSDSQSLVDLLRLAVREEHEKLTACFAYDTPRADVIAAVESFWQELCRSGEEDSEAPEEALNPPPAGAETPVETGEESEAPEEASEPAPLDGEAEPLDEESLVPQEVEYPPCPWTVRFYPDKEIAEIVEILLVQG